MKRLVLWIALRSRTRIPYPLRVRIAVVAARSAARELPRSSQVEAASTVAWIGTVVHELRYAARTLRRAPLFTVACVVVLALGIGVTTAVFSLVDAALLRPLAFRDAGRLVMLWERSPSAEKNPASIAAFVDWKGQNQSFASVAASFGTTLVALSSEKGGPPDTVAAAVVTSDFFNVLGMAPRIGRTFDAHDDRGNDRLVVVGEPLWRSRYGADPALVGRRIALGAQGTLHTVVGVVPTGVQILGAADLWQLIQVVPASRTILRGSRALQVIARLKPDVTLEQARVDMELVGASIAAAEPATNRGWSVFVEPLQDAIVGSELRTTTLALGGVVLCVLLLACANVANLVLVRGIGRTREAAVRAALGGSRSRIAAHLLTESALLGCLGGAAGLAVAWSLLRVAPSLIPAGTIPESIVLQMDWRLGAFALIATFVTALLFGLVPAWQLARTPFVEAAAAGGRGVIDGRGRVREGLVVVEIAAAVLLMSGAGLLVRTLVSLNEVDPGYRADNVVTMTIRVPAGRLAEGEAMLARYFQSVASEIGQIPGVRLAAVGSSVPFAGLVFTRPFEIVGAPAADPANRPVAHYQMISPRYFDALGIPLLRGRAFTDGDTDKTVPIAIVNEAFARRYLGGPSPVGARIVVPTFALQPALVTREVVGVIRQVRTRPDERADEALEIYVPLAQNTAVITTVVVRAVDEPMRLLPAIRAAVSRIDPLQIVTRVKTLEMITEDSTARPRFRAQVVAVCAALAAALAAVGIFSVLMFTVQQRAREYSIRMAVGAVARDLLTMVFQNGLKLAGAGVALGLAASLWLSRFVESLLFGISPLDPTTFVSAPAALLLIALLACVVPALRTLRADPASVLRAD